MMTGGSAVLTLFGAVACSQAMPTVIEQVVPEPQSSCQAPIEILGSCDTRPEAVADPEFVLTPAALERVAELLEDPGNPPERLVRAMSRRPR